MDRKQQSLLALMVKMRGSPVSTASWPTISPGRVTNRQLSSWLSTFRWYTCSSPDTTNRMFTSWSPCLDTTVPPGTWRSVTRPSNSEGSSSLISVSRSRLAALKIVSVFLLATVSSESLSK